MGSNPVSGSYENGHWGDPPTEGDPKVQNRTSVEDQLIIAELRLYKKRKKKKKENKENKKKHDVLTHLNGCLFV